MLGKQRLELFIAALLPVCVLGIGFIGFSVMAGLNPGETANPAASGSYYRSPGVSGTYFGSEIRSDTLCPGAGQNDPNIPDFNNGFDITNTVETATVSANSTANGLDWIRLQDWTFGNTPPWGTNYSNITLNTTVHPWGCLGEGPHPWPNCDETPGWDGDDQGFPWNGTETHWRNGTRVDSNTDVFFWDAPNSSWACVDYRIYVGWEPGGPYWYDCVTGTGRPDTPGTWIREPTTFVQGNPPHTEGKRTGNIYPCKPI